VVSGRTIPRLDNRAYHPAIAASRVTDAIPARFRRQFDKPRCRRTGDGQLARFFNAAWAAHLWKSRQIFHALFYAIIRGDCSPRTIRLNVVEDSFAICKCKDGPFQDHELSLFLEKGGGAALGKVCFNLLVGNGGTRIIEGFRTLARNQASCSAAFWANANGRAPSFAVRVRRMRTASETVIPARPKRLPRVP